MTERNTDGNRRESARALPAEQRPDLLAESEDYLAIYTPEYLRACADDDAREERLAELRRRIENGAYRVDPRQIAEHFLAQEDS